MIPIIGPLISALDAALQAGTSIVQGWQNRQTARAESAARIEEARANAEITRLQKAEDAEVAWDNAGMAQMEHSYKDEWILLLISIPMIMSFIPGLVPYVESGFTALDKTPAWYQWAIAIVISGSYGYRKFADAMGRFFTKGA